MPLSFLVPAFLAGLAALAVPLIVHLVHREKNEAVEFPSLMFLQQIRHKSVQRRRLHNLPLLLLRLLALLLIVGAFARPFVTRDVEAAALDLAREVVILLDVSYSMGHGERWAEASAAARSIVDGIRPEDRASLVLFGTSAAAMTEPTSDRARLLAQIDLATPGHEATHFGPALRLAQSILGRSDRPRAEVMLVSDMQRSGWDAESAVRLPAGVTFTPVAVGGEPAGNVTVTDASVARELFAQRERVTITAALANLDDSPVASRRVTLELDGRAVESRTVSLEPRDGASIEFAPVTLPDAGGRFTVRAEADGLPADDELHLFLAPGRALRVLVLESGAGGNPSLFLTRALAIGDAPSFRVETKPVAGLRPDDLAGVAAVVLNDAPFPGGAAGRALIEYVRAGGGLIVAVAERGGGNWAGEAATLLPGTFGGTVDRTPIGGVRFGAVNASHPALEPVGAAGLSGARFFRYRPIEGAAAEHVLARFDDGAVALAERSFGVGRVLAYGSSLDTWWNDLPLQPSWLPLAHELVAYAAAWDGGRDRVTIGDVVSMADGSVRAPAVLSGQAAAPGPEGGEGGAAGGASRRPAAGGDAVAVIAPDGARVTAEQGLFRAAEPGFYELRGGAGGGVRHVAVNVDRAESDLAAFTAAEVAERVTMADPQGTRGVEAAATATGADWERRQAFWWYLLVIALLLLVAESMLAGRFSRRPAVR
jgi:hypothetical protein